MYTMKTAARDSFDTLCRLYGDEQSAQALMRVRGATSPKVARLAKSFLVSKAAVRAAREYGKLSSLSIGYGRLMTASNSSCEVRRAVAQVATFYRCRLTPQEIDLAIQVVVTLG